MFVHVYVDLCTSVRTCVCVGTPACVGVCVRTGAQACAYVHVSKRERASMRAYRCLCPCVCIGALLWVYVGMAE